MWRHSRSVSSSCCFTHRRELFERRTPRKCAAIFVKRCAMSVIVLAASAIFGRAGSCESEPQADISKAIAHEVTDADPLLPLPRVYPLTKDLAADSATARLNAVTLAVLAFIAFALAIGGIYAVVSYGVTQRTHELGVRMALGARAAQIVPDVLARAMGIATLGVLAGIVGAAIGARAIAGQFYGVGPFDPLAFGVVILTIALASAAAAVVPARRATRVDPIVALRYE